MAQASLSGSSTASEIKDFVKKYDLVSFIVHYFRGAWLISALQNGDEVKCTHADFGEALKGFSTTVENRSVTIAER